MDIRKSFTVGTSTLLWVTIILWTISELTDYYGIHNKHHNAGRVVFVVCFICFFVVYAAIASNYLEHYDYISQFTETNPTDFLNDLISTKPILENVVNCLSPVAITTESSVWTSIEQVKLSYTTCTDNSPSIPILKGPFVDMNISVTLQLSPELEETITRQQKELETKLKYEPGVTAKLQFTLSLFTGSGTSETKRIGFINNNRPFYFNSLLRNGLFFVGLGIFLDLYIQSRTEECNFQVLKSLD